MRLEDAYSKVNAMKTTRDVTVDECPWLGSDIPAGTEVYRFYGATYGCISWNGVAVSFEEGKNPFFEIPRDALDYDGCLG